jgi:hypothetical protein
MELTMIVEARPPKRLPQKKKPAKPPLTLRVSVAAAPGKRRLRFDGNAAPPSDQAAEARVQAFLARMIRPPVAHRPSLQRMGIDFSSLVRPNRQLNHYLIRSFPLAVARFQTHLN